MNQFLNARVAISVLMLFLTGSAFADPDVFVGNWSGKGTYILSGDMTQCSLMKLEFAATATEFTFVSGRRECEKHTEDFYEVTMEYRDGNLYYFGQKVGTYDGNVLTAGFRAPDGNSFRNWRMTMRREGNNLMYEESRTMEGQVTPLISFAGLLIKQ